MPTPKQLVNKLDPRIILTMLQTIQQEPKGTKDMHYASESNQHTIAIYAKALHKRGILTPEVGEGSNGQYIILYSLTQKGRDLLPKLKDVVEALT